MLLILLAACSPAAIEVGDGTKVTENGDTETVDTADSGTDSGTDSAEDTSPPDPVTDFSTFTATTHFLYSGIVNCDETITGVGTELDSTDGSYASLAANCTTCTNFYRVEASQDYVCQIIPVRTTYRAMFFSGALAAVYVYADDGRGGMYEVASAPDGTFDGTTLTYNYSFNIGVDIAVDETAVFPVQ